MHAKYERFKIYVVAFTLVSAVVLMVTSMSPLAVANVLDVAGRNPSETQYQEKPAFLSAMVYRNDYDGLTNDLLTAGLGKSGLMGVLPEYEDALNPTPAELRRNAIYANYRATIDHTAAGGFGRLYGPNIDRFGHDSLSEGLISGSEYIAFADDGSGQQNITLMVQIPSDFDPNKACIVTAASSGSRGVYGAIGTVGEWGLKRGCAVTYTDKGTGNGLYDVMVGKAMTIHGQVIEVPDPHQPSMFSLKIDHQDFQEFNTHFPHRVAFKHAHSLQNPEKDWGQHTLDSIQFALYVLNEHFFDEAHPSRHFNPDNTLVIASSVSNGAGAAIAAAELDNRGLIDGVAVSEPNIQTQMPEMLRIVQGELPIQTLGLPLLDYISFANLYQPCAVLSLERSISHHLWPDEYTVMSENRCQALYDKGLLEGESLNEQANHALQKLHAYGWQQEHDFLHQSHFRFATNAIAVTYLNAYGQFSVTESICGFSMANTDSSGQVVPQNPLLQANLFASGSGIPPTPGVNLVYDPALGGATLDFFGISPSSGLADFSLDGALCIRALTTGIDPLSGMPLTGKQKLQSERVISGIEQVKRTAQLQGTPTIIVAGRNDALIPPNHAGRAYYGANQILEGDTSNTRYIEVIHAQHFDGFLAFGPLMGYDTRYIPLNYYLFMALDHMYEHLTQGKALPDSQVVRAEPRQSNEALAPHHLPPIVAIAESSNRIRFNDFTLLIPE